MWVFASLGVVGCGDREKENPATEEPTPKAGSEAQPEEAAPKAPPRAQAPASEGPTHERLVDAMGDQMDAFAVALSSVKDEASIAQVRESLSVIESEMRKIATQLEGMTPPSNAERERLSGLMQAREEAMEDLLGSREDFLDNLEPPVREALLEAMEPFNAMLEEIGVVLEMHFEPDPAPDDPDPVPDGEPLDAPPAVEEDVPAPVE